jgi:long-subunit fatty acid transport protein
LRRQGADGEPLAGQPVRLFFGFRGKQATMRFTGFSLVLIAWIIAVTAVPCRAATLFQQVGIASPPVPVGSGARAMGLAGAFIAVADDATAASWNPGGLIQVEKPEFSVVGAYTSRQTGYVSKSLDIGTSSSDEEGSLNYLSLTYPFYWHKNIVVSLNYQRLFEFNRSLDYELQLSSPGIDLEQRVAYVQDGFIGAAGLAGAVEITPSLSFGVTLNIWTDELWWDNGWQESYRARTTGMQNGVPVSIDTRIEEHYQEFRGVNANLGVLWESYNWGAFGLVVKTPFETSLRHTFRQNGTTSFGAPVNETLAHNEVRLEEEVTLHMPLSYGFGWSRRWQDVLTIGVDIHRTEWDDYKLVDSKGNAFSPIDGRFKEQSDVKATTHVRLGGEYVFRLPEKATAMALRAGLFYDPEPAEGSARDFFGAAVGAGVSRKRYSCDFAYQLRWADDEDAGNLIGGAKVDVVQHTAMLSLIWYF